MIDEIRKLVSVNGVSGNEKNCLLYTSDAADE